MLTITLPISTIVFGAVALAGFIVAAHYYGRAIEARAALKRFRAFALYTADTLKGMGASDDDLAVYYEIAGRKL